ncbi:hypothetical protein GCM10028817_10590 [Spirosoma pomorum]
MLGNQANVGVGTSAPTARLHVASGTAGQSGLRLENLPITTSASATNQNKFLSVDGSGNVILVSSNSSARQSAESEGQWSLAGGQLRNLNEGSVVIGPGVSRFPAGYRLYVSEGILTEKVKVAVKSTDDWSDKVFESGYRLWSLSEVDRYVRSHKHLPGVPSASDVVSEGVDVGQMQAKLLEKIEELTLHVIQLQSRINTLEKQGVANKTSIQKNASKTSLRRAVK